MIPVQLKYLNTKNSIYIYITSNLGYYKILNNTKYLSIRVL